MSGYEDVKDGLNALKYDIVLQSQLTQMTANEEALTSPAIQALKYLFPESTTMSECTQQIKAAAKPASGARQDVEPMSRTSLLTNVACSNAIRDAAA